VAKLHERRWGALLVIAAVAIAAGVMIRNTRSATAIEGRICGQYDVPQDAEVHQVGVTIDANKNPIIVISYRTTDGGRSDLTIPFDTIAATCSDSWIRGIVAGAQEGHREVIQSSCKFVGDLLAGRVQLPPDVREKYDRAYAEEWYRKTCLGTK